MHSRLVQLFAAIVVSCIGFVPFIYPQRSAAQSSETSVYGIDRIEPDHSSSELEARLLRDAADETWDEHSLFTAALVASGVATDVEIRGASHEFAELAKELKSEVNPLATAEQRAAQVLEFLHRRLLAGGYDLQATKLPAVLATGRYNCVSATVLFNSLAAETGINVGSMRLPCHTCSLLLVGDRRIRVEATAADWFTAGDRPQLPLAAEIGDAPVSASPLRECDAHEPVSDVALVAMIYYNRGVESLAHREFPQAIALNRRALRLDSHNAHARANLLAALNKQALALAERGHFSAALATVDEGLAIDPDHAALQQNRAVIQRGRRKATDTGSSQMH